MVYTIKSSAAALSDTPSTVSSANRVLLQNTGTSAAVVTIKSDDTFQSGSAAVQGTVYVQAGSDLVIKKDRLFTLEVANGVTTLYATSVGVEG